ncbi:hypothetical protein B0H13DRAFT_1869166 [Mycena leptocephala]|nr:hypothetical protein B0H13DRAFT_1869166 [Mycena leptocephala]
MDRCSAAEMKRFEGHPAAALNHSFKDSGIQEAFLPYEEADGRVQYLWIRGVIPSFDGSEPSFPIPKFEAQGQCRIDLGVVKGKCLKWPSTVAVPVWFYPRLKNVIVKLLEKKKPSRAPHRLLLCFQFPLNQVLEIEQDVCQLSKSTIIQSSNTVSCSVPGLRNGLLGSTNTFQRVRRAADWERTLLRRIEIATVRSNRQQRVNVTSRKEVGTVDGCRPAIFLLVRLLREVPAWTAVDAGRLENPIENIE